MPKISIIVPIYNTEKYLNKCLDSLINQTLKDIEILLVNDGSTDNSQAIIDEYVSKSPSIFKSFYQENAGQATARNLGIKNATGEFIAFVDSDDYVEENAYEIAYNYASKNNLDIVCFDFNEIVNNCKTKSHYYNMDNFENNNKKYVVCETSPCNKIIKSQILKNNNIYFLENHIYEDFAVIPTLAKYTDKIGFIDKCLYNYVIRNDSTMRQVEFNNKLYDIYDVMDNLYNSLYDTSYIDELEYLYIEHLLHGASLRFLDYKEGIDEINKISDIIKNKFPNWNKNIYYKSKNIKYKIICSLLYKKHIKLVKLLLKK